MHLREEPVVGLRNIWLSNGNYKGRFETCSRWLSRTGLETLYCRYRKEVVDKEGVGERNWLRSREPRSVSI